MRRLPWIALGALLTLSLAGCSPDPREGAIGGGLGNVEAASADLSAIKDEINKAVKKSQKDNVKLTAADFKDALTAVEHLKDDGKKLAEIRNNQADALPPISAEEKEDYVKRYQDRLTSAIDDLQKNKKALNEALVEAETVNRQAVVELRKKIREAEGEFEALARQS